MTRIESTCSCLPHGRGDVSIKFTGTEGRWLSSPRAWGCFHDSLPPLIPFKVFPTGVGMFLLGLSIFVFLYCLPHGRGDVSE